jgi:hypothetical protein
MCRGKFYSYPTQHAGSLAKLVQICSISREILDSEVANEGRPMTQRLHCEMLIIVLLIHALSTCFVDSTAINLPCLVPLPMINVAGIKAKTW